MEDSSALPALLFLADGSRPDPTTRARDCLMAGMGAYANVLNLPFIARGLMTDFATHRFQYMEERCRAR